MEKLLDGSYLYTLMWKAFRSVEKFDRKSIDGLDFACLSDFALLEVLYHKGPLPVNTIGKKVMLTSGSITTAVNRAVKHGWVERRKDKADGRVALVHLTSSGQTVIKKAFERHSENLNSLFSSLNREEASQFAELMKKIGKQADQRLNG